MTRLDFFQGEAKKLTIRLATVDDHRHIVFIVCAVLLFAAGLGAFAGLRVRSSTSPEKEYAEIKETDLDDQEPERRSNEGDTLIHG